MLRSPAFLRGVPALNTDAAGPAPTDAFGPFRVLHQIGAGALGPVFRAYHQEQDRLVAIKLLRLDLPPERVHQLVAELEHLIAADLSHPAIAAPIATGIAGATAYLALDFVAAESLDVVVRDSGPMAPESAVRVAAQLGEALDAAAALGILHGALHPRDILMTADDARMTGLGVVRAVERVAGAPPVRRPYTAPERASGGTWDQRADVFSLAALTFELLTGKRISGLGEQAANALPELLPANAAALRSVFARALAEDPGDRFEHNAAFVEALQQAIDPVSSRPARKRRKLPAPEAAAAVPVAAPTSASPPSEPQALSLESTEGTDEDLFLPVTVEQAHGLFTVGSDAPFEASADDAGIFPDSEPSPEHDARTELFAPEIKGGDLPLASDARRDDVRHSGPDDLHPRPPVAETARDEFRLVDAGSRAGVVSGRFDDVTRPIERPAPSFAATLEQTRSALWPIALALVLGIAVGFGVAMLMLGRDGGGQLAQDSAAMSRPAQEVADPPIVTEPVTPPSAQATPSPAPDSRVSPGAPAPSAAEPAPQTPPPAASQPAPAPPPPAAAAATPPDAATAAAIGRLLVRSTPAGARVSVDGKDVGTTPLTLRDLSRGSHTVRVARDGYRTMERRISLTASRPSQSMVLELVREPPAAAAATPAPGADPRTGSLVVDSRPPGARVFLDGRLIGTTPLTMPAVPPGDHAIHMEQDGYQRWTSSVRIVGGEQSKVAGSLSER